MSACDLCETDAFRRLMGYNLCRTCFDTLMDEQPADMYGWLSERAKSQNTPCNNHA